MSGSYTMHVHALLLTSSWLNQTWTYWEIAKGSSQHYSCKSTQQNEWVWRMATASLLLWRWTRFALRSSPR